jgi:RNA polymerase sigma-70 factor (ECF subfamily)
MDGPTSLTLLDRARNRDEAAWRSLIHLYGPLVARWCAHKGILGADSDDVQQQVFQAVALHLADFRHERTGDTFRGWLRIITRNKILDYFRQRAAQPEAEGGTDAQLRFQELPEVELPEDSPEDLSGLYHRALELVRAEFEERTWTAFWRAAVGGETPADIAADMNITAAAVRKAKSRVLLRLREVVGDLIV